MSELYEYIGTKIRELRQNYAGRGLSQEELAREMKTTANTVSRWETAAYKPSAKDLHHMAQFFGVNISLFFPSMDNARVQALLSALGNLGDEDIDELTQYAQFRKARQILDKAKQSKKGKKS